MDSERGQASVEWVGLVLLLALGLVALGRFAVRQDARDLGPELVHAIGCAARGGCKPAASGRVSALHTLATAPPLVPVTPTRTTARTAPPRGRPVLPARGRALAGRAWRRVGRVYRGSWMFCLGYERVRYELLHPESNAPNVGIPLSESIRMANDCVSPVDLVRDYELIRGGR